MQSVCCSFEATFESVVNRLAAVTIKYATIWKFYGG